MVELTPTPTKGSMQPLEGTLGTDIMNVAAACYAGMSPAMCATMAQTVVNGVESPLLNGQDLREGRTPTPTTTRPGQQVEGEELEGQERDGEQDPKKKKRAEPEKKDKPKEIKSEDGGLAMGKSNGGLSMPVYKMS